MSDAIIGALRVVLGLDSVAFEDGVGGVQKSLNKLSRNLDQMAGQFARVGVTLSAALTAPLVAFGVAASKAATESAQAMGQIEARLKSMGGVAGFTAKQLQDAAGALQDHSLYDDDDILRQVTATLLTFGNVAGDVFMRGQKVAIDMSAALDQDLKSSVIQIGKALNDPVKGLTALSRVGVSFTEQQQNQIKALVQANDQMGAQKIILGELEREFGGAAQAMRDNDPFGALKESMRNLSENVGGVINTAIVPLVNALNNMLVAFNNASPAMQGIIVALAGVAAAAGPVSLAIGGVLEGFSGIAAFLASDAVAAALPGLAAALGPIAAAAAAIAAIFIADWPKISPVLTDLWSQFQQTVGKPLIDLFNTVEVKIQAFWESGAGQTLRKFADWLGTVFAEAIRLAGSTIIASLSNTVKFLSDVVDQISALFKFAGDLIHGDWANAWQDFVKIVDRAIRLVVDALGVFMPQLAASLRQAMSPVEEALSLSSGRGHLQGGHGANGRDYTNWNPPAPHSSGGGGGGGNGGGVVSAPMVKPFDWAAATKLRPDQQGQIQTYWDIPDKAIQPLKDMNVILPELIDKFADLKKAGASFASVIGDAFYEATSRGKNFFASMAQGIQRLISQWASNDVERIFDKLFKVGDANTPSASPLSSVVSSIGHTLHIPGFANGVRNFAGGLATINERGGELVDLPAGTDVYSHSQTMDMLRGRGSAPYFDLRGAVVTQDLIDQMNRIGAQAETRAVQASNESLKAYDSGLLGNISNKQRRTKGRV